ncbi:hypothetical protein DH2020_022661 [Rehmannia glutinosa]|uniref:Uncharacterized protein n=1 Tax=Rehmannia glutinosa TaxID=99300 RepID=A0ABR0W3T1_REHGL
MDDKKLNFNQPLLSVRRYPPTATSRRSDQAKPDNSHPVIPRLPPHRSELKSGPLRNPGAVPFLWEHTPGQPKQDTKPQTYNIDKPPIAPKLPPGRSPKANREHSQTVHSISTSDIKRQTVDVPRDENIKNIERSKETTEEKESSDSGDSDEAYVDALETLSRTDSFFGNCSMSGLSGTDDLDVNPSRSFSKDLQAQEFMMDRFLPAAKAMASENPQYAPKKQIVVQQQQKQQQIKKTVNQNKPSLRYGPSFAKRYSHYEEEEEESDDEYDEREHLRGVCGLLPRFCLKSSLVLLNPVPRISVRTRVPMSSANKVQPRSSSAGSYSETEYEQSRSDRTEIKSVDKIQTAELDDDKWRNECGQLESHSTLIHVKDIKTFEELLADRGSPKESNSGGLVIEKTLYVDTVEKVEYTSNLGSFSHNTHDDTKGVPSSREEEEHDIITKKMDQMDAIDYSSLEEKTTNVEEKLLPNAHIFGDFSILLSSIDKSTNKCGVELPEDQDFKLDSTITENIQVIGKEATESLENELSRAITLANCHQNNSRHPFPPPLPKSPSDSWLWRTLPSVSTKNSSLRSYLGAATNPQNQFSKAPTSDTKWETIVKTTKVQRRHLHYSEVTLFVS